MEKTRSQNWWNVTTKKCKRWSRRLTLLLFVSTSLFALPDAESLVCIKVLTRVHPSDFLLKITDKVKIEIGGLEEDAVFLGKMDGGTAAQLLRDSEGETPGNANGKRPDLLYFWHPNTGFILHLPAEGTKIEPEFSATPNEKGSHIQSLRIKCQDGPSCAGYSTLNGVEYAKELGFLLPALRAKSLFYDPLGMLNEVKRSEMNFMHRSRFPSSVFGTVYDAPKQVRFQQDFLQQKGLAAKLSGSMTEIEKHLNKGLPAILNLMVRYDKPQQHIDLSNTNGNAIAQTYNFFKPDAKRTSGSGHSVLALGIMKDDEGNKKILIADSAFGNFAIWDYNETKKALWESVLISPGAQ